MYRASVLRPVPFFGQDKLLMPRLVEAFQHCIGMAAGLPSCQRSVAREALLFFREHAENVRMLIRFGTSLMN